MLDLIKDLLVRPKYRLYFDNFFISLHLLDNLTARSVGAAGTLCSNHTDRCPLIPPSEKKKDRGHIDHRYDKRGKAGAELGFYKGGCPIHLKGAPPNYFDPCYRNQTIFLALEEIAGARRSYDIKSYAKSLTKFL